MTWLPDLRKDGAALRHISWPPKSASRFKQCLSFDVLLRPTPSPIVLVKTRESAVLAISQVSPLLLLMLGIDLNKSLTLMLHIGLSFNLHH